MDSSGFSSPRSDCFPAGLRVLVVDDDPTWLKILEKMLKKCNYEVTTCNLAREALDLLRERKDGFEIVISDVNMPDMDGFKLLEHVGLEMDLPVIMMSVDGETSRVMKGVQHGACDYLLKPIRMKELRNIWQHVYRKRIHEVRDIEGHESFEEIQLMRNGMEHSDDNYLFGGDFVSGKKRKDVDSKHDDRTYGDHSSVKKARVVWTVDLHQKFVKAVNQIGFEKVGPKKILDLMGVPWLTRENVASHLQKYRLYLTRLQQENELKATFGGLKHSDFSPEDPPANAGLQNSMALQSESYNFPGPKLMVHKNDSKISEGNVKKVLSMSKSEPKNSLFGGSNDPPKSTATSRISFSHSFGPLDSHVKPEPKMQARYSWSSEVSSVQFKQEHKQKACFETEKTFDHLPQSMHRTGVDSLEQSLPHNPEPSTKESGKPAQRGSAKKATKVKTAAALFSVQPGSPFDTFVWNSKNHGIDEENLFDRPEPSQRNLFIGTGSALKLSDEELNFYSSQGEFYPSNAEVGNIGAFGYNDLELIADVPPNLYDPWSFGWEYPRDPVEYPVIDQGLFA